MNRPDEHDAYKAAIEDAMILQAEDEATELTQLRAKCERLEREAVMINNRREELRSMVHQRDLRLEEARRLIEFTKNEELHLYALNREFWQQFTTWVDDRDNWLGGKP